MRVASIKPWPCAAILLASMATGKAVSAPLPSPYVTIVHQVEVARPAAAVWARIGHYCDLSRWLGKPCEIIEGRDGEVGAIRLIDHQTKEVLVGRTATSYTYAQPESTKSPTHFYHGTLDVEPISDTSSRIVYTLFYDNSAIAGTAARAQEVNERSALFEKAVETMRSLAEAPAASH